VLPSVPEIVTPVAFVAATVNVDEPPEVIEIGLAVMLTVGRAAGVPGGVTVTVAVAVIVPPAPVAVVV
jgi:hypothetical protein